MRKLFLILSVLILSSCSEKERFKIKITFCDDRDPIITTTDVRRDRPPSTYDIDNVSYRRSSGDARTGGGSYITGVAVPEYITYEYIPSGSPIKAYNYKTKKYLNVCDVEVIY